MRNKSIYMFVILLAAAACGGQGDVEEKKNQLAELKKQVQELNDEIATLESEIAMADPEYNKTDEETKTNAILVSTEQVNEENFVHRIEARGSVASRQNVLLSSQIGGEIESIRVSEGQRVAKGQVLLTLDADVIRNNIAELKTSLELAKVVYERQSNLWEKKIGTEIQYLEAKNKKESLERKLATAQSQLDQAIIKAPFAGSVDEIPAKVGEMASPGMPLVRMVSESSMYIDADVSERYIGDFNVGDKVDVYFPVQDKRFTSEISFLSEVINSENRTFKLEVKLPNLDFKAKPNQVVVLELTDYETNKALVVPSEIILTDKEGKFLYTTEEKDTRAIAKKQRVKAGKTYNGKTEILSGLTTNDQIITEGYRNVSDGVQIKNVKRNTETAQL